MDIRNLAVGAVVTVLTTVVGGVALFFFGEYFAVQDEKNPPALSFYSQDLNQFTLLGVDYSSYKVLIQNNHSNRQDGVILRMVRTPPQELIDIQLRLGADGPKEDSPKPELMEAAEEFMVEKMLPNEIAEFTFVFSGVEVSPPSFSVKSESYLGKDVSSSIFEIPQERFIDSLLAKILFVAGYILFVIPVSILILRKYRGLVLRRRTEDSAGYARSSYNSAFALLHKGLAKDALSILDSVLVSRGFEGHEASAAGLAHAVMGDKEKSEALFEIADWFTSSKRGGSLVEFNKVCAHIVDGNTTVAKERLISCIENDPEMLIFARNSKYVFDLKSVDSEIADLLDS